MNRVPMATKCPECTETVRPVVTLTAEPDEESFEDCVDREAGFHCPSCGYRFAEVDEVFLNEHER